MKYLGLLIFVVGGYCNTVAQTETKAFIDIVRIETTPVKQQYKSITCWSFAVTGMLEADILREKKEYINLSEMFVVYENYIDKARHYLRMHGKSNFTGGGALTDPLRVIDQYGIMPTEAYSGLIDGKEYPDHFVMDLELKMFVDSLVNKKTISNKWIEDFKSILEKYMGKIPETFQYKGTEYTPLSFNKYLNISSDQYQTLVSFQYKPWFENMVLEVPDNWSSAMAFNIPLDTFMKQIDYSLKAGYTVAITLDYSEHGFDFWGNGIAILSKNDTLNNPFEKIDEKTKQMAFDQYETTDDHALLICGIAHYKNGKKFYLAKNSWGKTKSCYDGFLYLSENYVRCKSIAALFNKKSLESSLNKRINAICVK